MARRDEYYNRAKQEGYRSRAAYKLRQLHETADLIARGNVVVDLGAAPGGWLQVAAELAGSSGTVLGVDRQSIDPIDGVAVIQGDLTDESTVAEIVERVDQADVVLSDMSPNVSGEYELDHARSVHLARQALEVARELLGPDGDLAVKVFDGPDVADLRSELDEDFEYVRTVHPAASRDASSELYLVAKGRLTAPVGEGDHLTVEIVDVGREGDGIAKVEEFTVFVPGTDRGETTEIVITDVKPRFAFAERVT